MFLLPEDSGNKKHGVSSAVSIFYGFRRMSGAKSQPKRWARYANNHKNNHPFLHPDLMTFWLGFLPFFFPPPLLLFLDGSCCSFTKKPSTHQHQIKLHQELVASLEHLENEREDCIFPFLSKLFRDFHSHQVWMVDVEAVGGGLR